MITLQKVKLGVFAHGIIFCKMYIAKTEKGMVLMLLALGQMLDFSDTQLSKNCVIIINFLAYFTKFQVY